MKIRNAMICNAAEVRGSMLYVLGGAPEWIAISEIPGQLALAVALTVEHLPADIRADIGFAVLPSASDRSEPQGRMRAELARTGQDYVDGAPMICNVALRLPPVEVGEVGGWRLQLTCDGTTYEVPFGVRLGG